MSDHSEKPLARVAADMPLRVKPSHYPPVFAERVKGRAKRPLGDAFGITNFGVNLTVLAPGAVSALMHRHSQQDEFIYILEGTPTLATESGEMLLAPGMCAGFPKQGEAHQLRNDSNAPVTYLEIGDRSPGDSAEYPIDDLAAHLDADGKWVFTRKDGSNY